MWLIRKAMIASVRTACAAGNCSPSLNLADLDHEIAIGKLAHRQSHSIAGLETRRVQHLLRLSEEGHVDHLVHETGRGVVFHDHERIAGPCLENSRDPVEARPRVDRAPRSPDAGSEAYHEQDEE